MTDLPEPREPTSRLLLAIVTGLALVWTIGVVVVPWLSSHDSILGSWLRLLYRPGCHQMPGRCLDLGFGPLAVCARCMGLYLGGCLGLVWTVAWNRSFRPRPVWLLVVAIPTIVDFISGKVGLPSFGNWLRFALALPLGLMAGLYLGDALIEIVRRNTDSTNLEFRGRDSVG